MVYDVDRQVILGGNLTTEFQNIVHIFFVRCSCDIEKRISFSLKERLRILEKAVKAAHLDCVYTGVRRRKSCASALEKPLVGGEPFLQIEPCSGR